MSNRSKLEKFADNQKFANVFENISFENPQLYSGYESQVDYKGRWKKDFFKNEYPLILELACGRGEYSLGLAQLNPQINIIGVDIKGARIWKGASQAIEQDLTRVAFIRTRIELIHHFFEADEVDEIWITFPDPFPRPSKSSKRLVSHFFLDIYTRILKDGAILHLKTDDTALFEFGLESIQSSTQYKLLQSSNNIYADNIAINELSIKTYYERMHLENKRTIKYFQARYSK